MTHFICNSHAYLANNTKRGGETRHHTPHTSTNYPLRRLRRSSSLHLQRVLNHEQDIGTLCKRRRRISYHSPVIVKGLGKQVFFQNNEPQSFLMGSFYLLLYTFVYLSVFWAQNQIINFYPSPKTIIYTEQKKNFVRNTEKNVEVLCNNTSVICHEMRNIFLTDYEMTCSNREVLFLD